MKKTCAGIGASLLFLAIAVLTVATVSAVRAPRGSSRPILAARRGVPLQASVTSRRVPEASSRPR